MSSPSRMWDRLEVLAAVVTDGRDEEVRRSRRRAGLPAVKIGTNEMTRADKGAVEREELEVVCRRCVWIARNGAAMAWIATHRSRRSRIKEAGPPAAISCSGVMLFAVAPPTTARAASPTAMTSAIVTRNAPLTNPPFCVAWGLYLRRPSFGESSGRFLVAAGAFAFALIVRSAAVVGRLGSRLVRRHRSLDGPVAPLASARSAGRCSGHPPGPTSTALGKRRYGDRAGQTALRRRPDALELAWRPERPRCIRRPRRVRPRASRPGG